MPPVELIQTRDYDDFVTHPSYTFEQSVWMNCSCCCKIIDV